MQAVLFPKYWRSNIEGTEKYDKDLAKEATKDPDKYSGKTWKDDCIENARCVWERWRIKAPKFNYFFTAARHVALVPISSSYIERAFSQVKFIIDTVEENLLEESLKTCLIERLNEY